jgi:adenylate cyclase
MAANWPGEAMRAALKFRSEHLFSELAARVSLRNLRLASGLVLFAYITAHLINHALGLISLDAAERGLEIAIHIWYSYPGTVLLYGAAAAHFLLALWSVYVRRTFRLPPLELLRIALGFTLPVILIGHAVATRLAWELFSLPSDYTRVVTNLWIADSQGMQLGLLAPGWLHGCLGLHFIFSRRPWYRQGRYVLFAVALLLPVFSAFGFIAMGRELSTSAAAAAIAMDHLSPTHAAQQIAMAQWRNTLLIGYFGIIGATFAARAVRNAVEHGRRRVVSISYPGRTVRVPRGWSVLEASRSFHIPHASMCGGRARCSTCRVQVTAGEDDCPTAEPQERATLDRIGAPPDVRLACQLRPEADLSVIPLVRTERPIYRLPPPQRSPEREIVVMFCDFLNRAELASDHMPQDLLYLLMRYLDAISNAIRLVDGTLSSVRPDSVCALFGLECGLAQAAHQALRAAAAIERAIADLNDRLGREGEGKVKIAISIHAGLAAVGEIGASDPPMVMAVGEALDVVNELRKAAAAQGKAFAISEPVYTAAGLDQSFESEIRVADSEAPVAVSLSESAPVLPVSVRSFRERRAALRQLWSRQ